MRHLLAATALVALAAAPALGQAPAAPVIDEGDVIIVTGRAGTGALRQVEASFAITTLDDEALRLDNPPAVADVFRNIPGFWVESSGGEASNNIRVRGIPRDGYSSIGLHEDGLPVQHDPGLGFLNADQSFRFDQTHARVEAVRGGPASIFSSNAPGGLVNFITRRPSDRLEAVLAAEGGDWGFGRLDAWAGLPILPGWGLGVGGFWRTDDGRRPTGFTANQGGQIRVSLAGDLGPGRLFLDVKHINDRVAFYLPVPLTFGPGGGIAGVPGFDPLTGTYAGRPTELLAFRSPSGDVPFDLSRGTKTELTQITGRLDLDLGAGWGLSNGLRVRLSETQRNGVFPATIGRASTRVAGLRGPLLAAVPTAADVRLVYADDGSPFDAAGTAGNGLVTDAAINTVDLPLDEVINDFRVTRLFDLGNQRHDVALGVYYAGFDIGFQRYGSVALLEAAPNARLLDVLVVNAAGQPLLRVTDRGFTRWGNLYNNASNTSDVVALYASDEWSIGDVLRVDLGLRWERLSFRGRVEQTRIVSLGDPTTLADDQVLTGTGVFDSFRQSFSDLGWTAGVNLQPRRDMGAFARYTSTFRLPNATDFLGTAVRTDLVKEQIQLAEAGLKLDTPTLSAFVTGFLTYFEGVRFTSNEFNPATGGFVPRVEFADARTIGVEAEGVWRPAPVFDLAVVATWQKPEFRGFRFTELVTGRPVERDFSGNQLLRVPELALRFVPGVNLWGERLRVQGRAEYFSRRFADAANTVALPSYWLLGATARLGLTDALAVYVYGDNLLDEIGLTEGNPRAGQFASGDAGAEFFLARPMFGRTLRASIVARF